jgi:hypothetical protein
VSNPNHTIDWNVMQVEHEGDFRVEPVCIMDQKFKVLRNKFIGPVNVQWTCYNPQDAIWEKETMRGEYLPLFVNFEKNKMQDSILCS